MTIYLDNQTSSRPSDEVMKAMEPYFQRHWASASAPHQASHALVGPLKEALNSIYQLIGAREEDHFVFTSSGAEAVNQAFFSTYLNVTRQTGKNQFLATKISEAASILSMERLQELGCVYQLIDEVTAQAVIEAMTPRTALLSISWADGLTGVIHSLKDIADVCKERGVILHVDATHVLGKGYFPWDECQADILTFNGEQFHSPKGTGGLFFRSHLEMSPLIVGGREQAGLRGGSLNVPLFMGLSKAAEEAYEKMDTVCMQTAHLRAFFEDTLLHRIPSAKVLFAEKERLPHLTTIHFPGVTSDALLFLLSKKGLHASLGGGHFQQISYLLRAMGIDSQGALSFSLSKDTTQLEIEQACEIIYDCFCRLRKCSAHILGDR